MARRITLVIALMLVFALPCVACNTTSAPSTTTPISTDATNSEMTASTGSASNETTAPSASGIDLSKYVPEEGKVYTIVMAPQPGPVDKDGDLVKLAEQRFGVDLEFWNTDGSNNPITVRLASGEVPDVVAVNGPNVYMNFALQGLFAEIYPEVVAQCMPGLYKQWMTISPNLMNCWAIEGKIYSFPVLNPETGGARHCIIYRGDYMETLGIDKAPTTLDEFEQLAYKVAQGDPDGNGKNDTYALSASGMSMVYGAYGCYPGYWVKLSDGTISHGSIQPQMKECLQKLAKWYQDGLIDPEFVSSEYDVYLSNAFATGRVAMTICNFLAFKSETWEGARDGETYIELKKNNAEAAKALVWGSPVQGPYGKGVIGEKLEHSFTISLGKQLADQPDKVAKIMQMYEGCNNALEDWITYRFGIEGTNYDMKEFTYSNGVTVKLPMAKGVYGAWPEIVKIGGGTALSTFWTPDNCNAALPEVAWAANEHPELFEDYKNGYVLLDAMYILPDIASQYTTEIDKLQTEAYVAIITGQKPIEYFDEYVKNWLNSGGQKIIDAINAGQGIKGIE